MSCTIRHKRYSIRHTSHAIPCHTPSAIYHISYNIGTICVICHTLCDDTLHHILYAVHQVTSFIRHPTYVNLHQTACNTCHTSNAIELTPYALCYPPYAIRDTSRTIHHIPYATMNHTSGTIYHCPAPYAMRHRTIHATISHAPYAISGKPYTVFFLTLKYYAPLFSVSTCRDKMDHRCSSPAIMMMLGRNGRKE